MPNSARITVSAPGAKQASSEMDQLRDKFAKLKSQGASGIISGAAAGATIGALGLVKSALSGVTDFMGDAIHEASDLNESMSKSSVVFGDASTQVSRWGDDAAKSMGLSKQAAIEAAASLGNLFTGLGKTKSEAADMSEKVVGLAGDLASFNNIDPTEALDKLRSGLSGEAEPLRSMGVFLTEAKVKAKAMQLGLADAHGELSEGAKVMARYQLILDETKTAQGDFSRTSDGLANKQRIADAQMKDSLAKIGGILLPAATAATGLFAGALGLLADNMNIVVPTLVGLAGVLTVAAIPSLVAFATAAAAAAVAAAPILLVGAGLAGVGLLLKAGWDMATQSSDKAKEALDRTAQAASDAGVAYSKTAQGMADDARESAHLTGQANLAIRDGIMKVGTAAQDAAQEAIDAYTAIQRASHKTRFALIDDVRAEIEDGFDQIITADRLAATNAEITANRRILASAKATAAEKRDARDAIHQLNKDRFEALADLAEHGKTSAKVYKAGVAGLLKELKSAHGAEADQIRDEIRLLNLLALKAQAAKTVIGQTIAKGGYVYAPSGGGGGKTTTNSGPRSAVMGDGVGSVSPTGGTGGGNVTFAPTVVIQGIATPAVNQAIITQLGPLFAQWLRSQGWKPA